MKHFVRASMLALACSFATHGIAQFWAETQVLPPAEVTANGLFGWSISMEGDLMLVGAPGTSDLSVQSGAAYLLQRDNGGDSQWDVLMKLAPIGLTSAARFGTSVLLQGGRAFVGAPLDIVNGQAQGSIYVFERNAGGENNWGMVQRLSTPQGSLNMRLGEQFSVGDFLIAGAPDYDISPGAGLNPFGGVAVFSENAQGLFQFMDLYDHGGIGRAFAQFAGRCFSGSSDACLITPFDSLLADPAVLYAPLPYSGPLESLDPLGQAPSVSGIALTSTAGYLYSTVRTPSGLQVHAFAQDADELSQLGAVVPDPTLHVDQDRFGESLTAKGERLVAGAPGGGVGLPLGWIGVYDIDPMATNGMRTIAEIVPSDPDAGSIFGHAVALDEGLVAAGAPGYGVDDRGKVYVFADPMARVGDLDNNRVLRAHPSPADQWLTVELDGISSPALIRLMDMNGRELVTAGTPNGKVTLPTLNVESGLYIVQAQRTPGDAPLTVRVLIQH